MHLNNILLVVNIVFCITSNAQQIGEKFISSVLSASDERLKKALHDYCHDPYNKCLFPYLGNSELFDDNWSVHFLSVQITNKGTIINKDAIVNYTSYDGFELSKQKKNYSQPCIFIQLFDINSGIFNLLCFSNAFFRLDLASLFYTRPEEFNNKKDVEVWTEKFINTFKDFLRYNDYPRDTFKPEVIDRLTEVIKDKDHFVFVFAQTSPYDCDIDRTKIWLEYSLLMSFLMSKHVKQVACEQNMLINKLYRFFNCIKDNKRFLFLYVALFVCMIYFEPVLMICVKRVLMDD